MPAVQASVPVQARLDALRAEFADLAFELERKGRRDAADVVMLIDLRVREMVEEMAAEDAGDETARPQSAVPVEISDKRLVCCRSGFTPDNQPSAVGDKPRPTTVTVYPGTQN